MPENDKTLGYKRIKELLEKRKTNKGMHIVDYPDLILVPSSKNHLDDMPIYKQLRDVAKKIKCPMCEMGVPLKQYNPKEGD